MRFNPRRPRGRRQFQLRVGSGFDRFNPRRPRGRRRKPKSTAALRQGFNPRRPRGRRPASPRSSARKSCFNPRRPRGRRPATAFRRPSFSLFQSAPPAWAATRVVDADALQTVFQSAPPAWAATPSQQGAARILRFQSAPPAWAATFHTRPQRKLKAVSIRAARVGGDCCSIHPWACSCCFNPRRPRGRRLRRVSASIGEVMFQSAPPAWAATRWGCWRGRAAAVSIRAARVGGDAPPLRGRPGVVCFNPRRPRGRRPRSWPCCWCLAWFQSAPPAWAATRRWLRLLSGSGVSIRAARVGGDTAAMPWAAGP